MKKQITAPDLPNLAFIDLPGLIQTTESVGLIIGSFVTIFVPFQLVGFADNEGVMIGFAGK